MGPNFGPIVQKPPKNSSCPQCVQILDPLSRSLPKTQAVHNGSKSLPKTQAVHNESKFWTHCPEASQKLRLSTMGSFWAHCPEASQKLRLSTMDPNFGPIVQKPPKNSGCPQWVQILDPLSRSLPKTQAVHNGSKFWTHCPEASQKLRLSTMGPNFGPIVQKEASQKLRLSTMGPNFGHIVQASQKLRLSTMGPDFGPIVQKPPKNSGCPQCVQILDPLSRSIPKTQAVHNGSKFWTHCPEASQKLRLSTMGPNFGPIVQKPPKNSGCPQCIQILDPLSRSLPKTQAVHNESKFWTHCPRA